MQQWQFNSSALTLAGPAIVIAMIFSLVGPAPNRLCPRLALSLMLVALLDMCLAVSMLMIGIDQNVGLALISAGIFVACFATWLARGNPGEDDGGGGGDDKDQPDWDGPQPDGLNLDWDDFDGHRSEWESKQHQPASVVKP